MQSQIPRHIFNGVLLLSYIFFSILMMGITLQYIPYDTDVAFLRIKQDEIALGYYKVAFFVHVYTSMFVLLAGATQFSKYILRKLPKVHKISGRIYVIVILLLSGPSGLVMAYHANGGWTSQLGFILLSIFWMFFTWKAYAEARKKNFEAHKRWMYRSFALTLSAITLRAWKYIIVFLFMPKPMDVYRIVAWIGWLVNLIIVEVYFRMTRSDDK